MTIDLNIVYLGDYMKAKVLEILLIGLIVLMLGGILASVKNEDDSTTTEIIEDFDKNSDFDIDGYYPSDTIDEDNENAFSRFGGQVGDIMSKGVNKGIDLMFDFFKKLVS